ncbi:lytic transglycosylase domain-containing protein [Yersinia enterocolitica]|uniref:lytic transglycosylase domain-containing protein n=1 Tax=Yersinia enterocolitica TaxID=630 RepID=UPI0028B8BF17|nr:lytic transglycosylase domain-containing protein [Yersinia enterocolitica]EKN4753737.1 lytic transglycosylase domain-containing protein [Yersinia enterocolitica]EKN6413527.1 lytic transglycosylase domain-containing protein [Yersinia enterocolitica]ELI8237544.1 lytic transglycosylase domain-containing protein [Yersinia enterocolitica]HDL8307002.1 lytic transglycosylase domain-containing protein [Yersinia enterocolitica]
MGNAFDFELTATDQASASIQRIEEAVKNLIPDLDKTRDGLKLGGQESVEGIDDLNARLKGMGQFAREGVQFVGDMVPPLKMVGEIGSKALRFGALGYIGVKAAQGLSAAADSAYSLDVAAKNAGMSVDNFSRVSGAMQILGVDSDSARQSVEGLYKTFNDPLWARNDITQALLAQNGIVIERLKDGTADVYKTLDNVAKIFPKLSPQTQKTLADALGLNAPLLALMREGARYKELLAKSDSFGLTVDPKLNAQLVELNAQLKEASAAIDGLMTKGKIWAAQKLLPDENMVKGSAATQLRDMKMRENDDENSFAHGDKQKDILHRARVDDKFKDTLSLKEKAYLTLGYPDKDFTQKLNDQYGADWEAQEKKRLEIEKQKNVAPVKSPYILPGEDQQQARLKQLESQYNLPSTLLDRVYLNESNRGKNLLSPKGAEGPFQFMPATGRDYGLNTREDRMDFNKSSEAAAKYLADLLKDFDGDVNQAVASYNWGQGNVKKHGLGRAPAETRNYLQKIMPGLPAIHPQQGELTTDPSNINVSPPTSINSSQQTGRDINDITQDTGGDKSEIEITLITDKTGERQKITAPKGAKISTSMNYS